MGRNSAATVSEQVEIERNKSIACAKGMRASMGRIDVGIDRMLRQ